MEQHNNAEFLPPDVQNINGKLIETLRKRTSHGGIEEVSHSQITREWESEGNKYRSIVFQRLVTSDESPYPSALSMRWRGVTQRQENGNWASIEGEKDFGSGKEPTYD